MTSVTVFLVGVAGTGLAAFTAVAYLTPSLRAVLKDLCGTMERANFWTAFSNLALILTPLIFAMHEAPDLSAQAPAVLQLAAQAQAALIGLVSTILVVGFVVSRFIPRPLVAPHGPAAGTNTLNGGSKAVAGSGAPQTGTEATS